MEWFFGGAFGYELSVVGRLLLAALLGSLIGFEREVHGRPAGFRTHLLVTLGACLMMVVSEHFFIRYGHLSSQGAIRFDPGRVAAQIVTGIGFLGAGAIIKDGRSVRGLTTAACLWVAAGIGMAVGVGFYIPALMVTGMALVSLMFLKQMENRLSKDAYLTISVFCADREGVRRELEDRLAEQQLRIIEFYVEKDLQARQVRYDFVVARFGIRQDGDLVEAVACLPGVNKVRLH